MVLANCHANAFKYMGNMTKEKTVTKQICLNRPIGKGETKSRRFSSGASEVRHSVSSNCNIVYSVLNIDLDNLLFQIFGKQ